MSDLIDRQAAIDALYQWMKKPSNNEEWQELLGVIQDVPPTQPEQRWIPVEIKPPKEKKTYWVCTDTGYQCECRWTNNRFGMIASDEWGWSIFDTPQYTKVVAWRELPEPYRKETEDAEIC